MQEGNKNQKRQDELDKHSSYKSAQSERSPGRWHSTLITILEEGSTRLVLVNEKEQILPACKFLLLRNQIHLESSRYTFDLIPDEVSFSELLLGRFPQINL